MAPILTYNTQEAKMDHATWWWLAAGMLVAAELLSGTFYLLMLALGLAAAAVGAHLGLGGIGQWVTATVAGAGSVLAWYLIKKLKAPQESALAANANLDIGAVVYVSDFNADGSCHTHYRGAHWDALLAAGEKSQAGYYIIIDIIGNRLLLKSQPNTSSGA